MLHSDGVSSRLGVEWYGSPTFTQDVLQPLTDSLLHTWARESDDATILLAVVASPARAGQQRDPT